VVVALGGLELALAAVGAEVGGGVGEAFDRAQRAAGPLVEGDPAGGVVAVAQVERAVDLAAGVAEGVVALVGDATVARGALLRVVTAPCCVL
jgi:hypothetical protein